ncbi:MAG: S8 family serine peptidase [Saprospiraceae bacterium]|nr:S8 family serine peptidase [Saprospiraceae bacterium]
MSLQRSIQFGGVADPRLHHLVDTPDRIVVRTRNHADPKTFWHTIPDLAPLLPDLQYEDAFPESGVYIYRIVKKTKEDSVAFRTYLKEVVRSAKDPRIEYIGTVLMYAHSGIYQIYTGNLFLKFHKGVHSSAIMRVLSEHQLSVKHELHFATNAYFLEAAENLGKDIFDRAQDLLTHPEVEYAHPELVVRRKSIQENPVLQSGALQRLQHDWVLSRINAPQAWGTTRGKGVRICIIDDGIELSHPAFVGKIIAQRDMLDRGTGRPPAHQFSEWHGTACASIACSADPKAPGVAPEAYLIPIRSMGLGSVLESEAFYWATKNGADIISCSWGPPDGNPLSPTDKREPYPIPDHTNLAIQYAAREGRKGKGCAVFFAAGNGNEPVWYDEYAAHPDVMAVGSTNRDDKKALYADFQSPLFCCFPSGEYEPFEGSLRQLYGVSVADRLGADGQDAGDYFSFFAGTSASCPGVAGVAALALSLAPELTRNELKTILKRSCVRVGDPHQYNAEGLSEQFGYGLTQADLAVENTLQYLNTTKPNVMNASSALVKAISLHIGINNVDPGYYKGHVPPLSGCISDMEKMEALAKTKGFSTQTMRNSEATREAILQFLVEQSGELDKNDILLITYAGHGAPIPDQDGDEADLHDESWVTYNGFLLDDELNRHFTLFKEGVRILVVSDSCHSGTMNRYLSAARSGLPMPRGSAQKARFLPLDVVKKILNDNKQPARALRLKMETARAKEEYKAAILLLAACQDDQYAMETTNGGVFTNHLVELVSANGKTYNYNDCISTIREKMPVTQIPKLNPLGSAAERFADQLIFSIQWEEAINAISNSANKSKKKKKVVNLLVETDKRLLRSAPPAGSRDMADRQVSVINDVVDGTDLPGETDWDKAYQLMYDNKDEVLLFVEPDIPGNVYLDPGTAPEAKAGRSADASGFIATFPHPEEDPHRAPQPFIWHLDNDHSQLLGANEIVFPSIVTGEEPGNSETRVKIAHIDTGFYAHSPTLPLYIDLEADVRFKLNGDAANNAEDSDQPIAIAEQEGHGNATLSILAGRRLTKQDTGGLYEGYFGAIPFARVLPLKISETVAIVSGKKFQRAVEYAIKNKVDVISMSMAGWPSRAMADAVNKAYENGIVIVSAASNCFERGIGKLLPSTMLYPARFDRTIGVVGAMVNHKPYLVEFGKRNRAEGGEYMQMCYGPKEAMVTAIAGYSPNISWFNKNRDTAQEGRFFVRTGGGTSSATPQVAAAAALYIEHNKAVFDALPADERWKIVEVVKKALFDSAAKDKQYKKYFGNGILRAMNALDEKYSAKVLLKTIDKPAPEAKTQGFFKNLFGLYKRRGAAPDPMRELFKEMMQTELIQLLHRDPALYRFLEYDLTDESFELEETEKQELIAAVLNSTLASQHLKSNLSLMYNPVSAPTLRSGAGGELQFAGIPVQGERCRMNFRAQNMGCRVVRESKGIYADESSDMVVDEIEIEISSLAARGGEVMFDLVTDLDKQGRQGVVLTEFQDGDEVLYQWTFEEAPAQGLQQRSMLMAAAPERGTFSISLSNFQQAQTRGGGFKPGKLILKLFSWLKPKGPQVLKKVLAESAEEKYGLYFYDLKRAADGNGNNWISASVMPGMWEKISKSNQPLLFLVPGTFSKIEKGFDELLCNEKYIDELADTYFQYALGFNMPTAAHGIEQNVKWLDAELKGKLDKKICHVLARSRGGLVARYAFEKHWKSDTEAPLKLGKLVMTATPNQGTHMANSDHWKDMINITTNLLGKVFIPASPAFETIGVVLKAIVNNVVDLPGIADQQLDGPFITKLNNALEKGSMDNYYITTSNYEPGSILGAFFDKILYDNNIFKGMVNDKVVPLDSARFKLKPLPNLVEFKEDHALLLGQSERINHFAYLKPKHKRSLSWILEKLTGKIHS